MKALSVDYYIMVTIAAFGVMQLAANLGGLKAMLIFRSPVVTRAFGSVLPAAAAVWFFSAENRNVSDHLGGLSSNEIALAFFVGVLTSWVVTVAITSLINAHSHRGTPSPGAGLEALREATYFRALLYSARYWLREWRTQMKPYFFG